MAKAGGFFVYFGAMRTICVNGKWLNADEPVLAADNRGYRYGDGLFETLKLRKGKILLEDYHLERLFAGMELLKMEIPRLLTAEKLVSDMLQLCKKNNCTELARVRLSVSRGNGGLYDSDNKLQYIIECWPLPETSNQLNQNGLLIDIFPDSRKSCDAFSNLKSANYLPYVMAAQFAKEHKLNDCLLLNQHERIADATIANVFIVKENELITPALSEGAVAGVMRRFFLEKLQDAGYKIQETSLATDDILHADEVFLTNAIHGIRWVKQFRNKSYTSKLVPEIYRQLLQTIFV